MTRITNYSKAILLAASVALVLLGCAGQPDMYWEADTDLPLPSAVYTTESGRVRWELPFPGSPYLEGEWEMTGQGRVLHVDSLQLFLNWPQGWTEVEYMTQGSIRWNEADGRVTAEVLEPIELLGVEAAAIRRRDTRLRGERAWKEARRRSERIEEIAVRWREFAPPQLLARARPDYPRDILFRRDNFRDYWGGIFFPEVYGWGPYWDEYWDENPAARQAVLEAETTRGEDIAWNQQATAHFLPQEYYALRTSGTLFRDFEEGLEWVYMVWAWDTFFESLLPEMQYRVRQ